MSKSFFHKILERCLPKYKFINDLLTIKYIITKDNNHMNFSKDFSYTYKSTVNFFCHG